MRKIIYCLKYYWHIFNYNHIQLIMKDCIDADMQMKLRKKLQHHEYELLNASLNSERSA